MGSPPRAFDRPTPLFLALWNDFRHGFCGICYTFDIVPLWEHASNAPHGSFSSHGSVYVLASILFWEGMEGDRSFELNVVVASLKFEVCEEADSECLGSV